MAKVILDQSQIVSFVGERKSARMTKHVGMDRRQAGAIGGGANQVVHGLSGQWLTTFGDE